MSYSLNSLGGVCGVEGLRAKPLKRFYIGHHIGDYDTGGLLTVLGAGQGLHISSAYAFCSTI